MDIINAALALLTIGFGAFGFLAPRYTASALDLVPTPSTMGLSELRAGSGGVFIAMALWCLLSGNTHAYLALGVVYFGAGAGRALSIALDKPPLKKALIFLAFEWPPAAFLLIYNWPPA